MAESPPSISHLLFEDDSLLFVKASVEGASLVSSLFDTYCQASGRKINHDKSSVFFSKGCPNNLRTEVKEALNITNESLLERYLGMPSDVGNNKNGAFKFLKDRLWNKVKGWLEKKYYLWEGKKS